MCPEVLDLKAFLFSSNPRHDMTRQQLQEYFEAQLKLLGSRAESLAFVNPFFDRASAKLMFCISSPILSLWSP